MASTTKTTNLELSQFVGTDKPAWLTDYNGDMQKIDNGYKKLEDANTATQADLDATKQDLSGSQTDINDVKASVQALEAQDIALGNRLTVVEGNYNTMHHEVAINKQNIAANSGDIAALKNKTNLTTANIISNVIGNNEYHTARVAGNTAFVRITTEIPENTFVANQFQDICDIDTSTFNPYPVGANDVFVGFARVLMTNTDGNLVQHMGDANISNGKIRIFIPDNADVTKTIGILMNITYPVEIK